MSRKRKAKNKRRARRPTAERRRRLRATPGVPRPKSGRPRAKPKKPSTRRITGRLANGSARRKATITKKAAKRIHRHAPDLRIEPAIRDMNRGHSMTAAAQALGISRKQLQDYLAQRRLATRKRGRWVVKDNRPRRVPVMTGGRLRVVTVRGYEPARLVGEHYHAVGEFVRTNDRAFIKPFEGQSVAAVGGRRYDLETRPNALHRIAAMDTPPFHEIYEITSNA